MVYTGKNIFYVLSLIALFLLALPQTYALGITPGGAVADYRPGERQTFTFTIINSEHQTRSVALFTQGDLNQSILLEQNSLSFAASEEEKKIQATLTMPPGLTPGPHKAQVVVAEIPQQINGGKAIVGAVLAVVAEITVYVPYPGKYVEGKLKVSGDEQQKKFVVAVKHQGKEKIDSLNAEIHIFDKEGKEVKKLTIDSISLQPAELREISATWAVDVPRGRYVAKAILLYDGESALLEQSFEVGEFALELLDLFVKDFSLGSIAKFNLLVKNSWSEPIMNVYAQMRVLDKAFNEFADVKSATYIIPSGEKTTIVYYWDTKGVQEGLYNANVLLYYGDTKIQHDLKLQVGKNSIQVIGLGRVISTEEGKDGGSIVTILFVVIGFLILLNVLWFVVLRKRQKK